MVTISPAGKEEEEEEEEGVQSAVLPLRKGKRGKKKIAVCVCVSRHCYTHPACDLKQKKSTTALDRQRQRGRPHWGTCIGVVLLSPVAAAITDKTHVRSISAIQ